MTEGDGVDFSKDEPADVVRQQGWDCDGAAEVEVTIDLGRVRIDLVDGAPGEVRVAVRHDPSAGGGWAQGLNGLINWLGSATGPDAAGTAPEELISRAVRAAEITWSDRGRRLVVRSPQDLALRVVPLAVTVTAPTGSRLAVRAGSGDVTVTGRAGWAAVRTGSGQVDVGAVDGDADVTTGSGVVELGPISGRGRIRTSSGAVRVAAVHGPTEVRVSSGTVTVVDVAADLTVRTGSGDVAVDDARSGRLDLTTGSGSVRVGVHAGVTAEVDLTSQTGQARSDLTVDPMAPAQPAALVVKARSGSGDTRVTRAAATPA